MKFIVRLQFKSNSKFSSFSDSALTDDILSKVSLGFMRGWLLRGGGGLFVRQRFTANMLSFSTLK